MTEEEQSTQVINWDINKAAIAEVAEDLKDVDAYKDLDGAKAAKKTLTKMRTALTEAHKETKAEALEFGRKVDAKKNEYLALIKVIEDPITDALIDIKNKAAREEEERIGGIMGHIERLQAFALDRHSLTLDELKERRETLLAEVLTEEVYQELLDGAQLSKDEAELKLRLAIDRETTRIEDERKAQEQAAENQRLADELAERQAAMDAEDVNRKEKQAAEDAERRKIDDADAAERKRKQDKIDEQQAAAQKKIDDENARIALETAATQLREREAAEEEERKNLEAENAARALEQAPDREKLLAYADRVDDLLVLPPVLMTDAANEVMLQAKSMLIEVAYDIRKQTEEMK
jgi:hypothetical protein